MRYLLFVVFLTSSVVLAAAQTKVLTNADLDKYRLEREKAEREYRENYAKRGFPSPEDLERRRRENDVENQKVVIRLNEQLVEAARWSYQRPSTVYYRSAPSDVSVPLIDYPYFWSYGRGFRTPVQRVMTQPGYFAGGQFWPTPVRSVVPARNTAKLPIRTHPK